MSDELVRKEFDRRGGREDAFAPWSQACVYALLMLDIPC